MKRFFLFSSLLCALGVAAQTERIVFRAPVMYPEGVAYHPQQKLFYVSSVKTGTIGSVDENGQYKKLYEDSLLRSSYGMKVDAKNNRLLVCIADGNYSKYSTPATYKKMARLLAIDLATGAKKWDVNLDKLYAGKHFANDLTLDERGNIYITDSYAPVIYKVDAQGKASVFAEHDWFRSEDVGLNGILYHPQGYLLVAHNTNGALYKVDVKNPKLVSPVKLKMFFPGADGLLWAAPNKLVLVQNKGANKIYQLSSTDNWASAEVKAATATEDRFQYPTTATLQDSRVWVLNAKLNENVDSSMLPSQEFSLQLARFLPMQ